MQIIRTALCSFGMSGRVFHAPFIQLHKGYELVGAWERTHNVLQQHYPNAKSYDSLEELLNDDIDLVIVNTPTYTHYEFAKQALLADKHVVVEKAFTTTVAEAEALIFLAKQQNLVLSVFHNRRWDSDFLTVKQVIESGCLGEIAEAEFCFDRFNLELSPKIHKENGEAGSGILLDLGPHIIDQALFLFGTPQAVFADIRKTRPQTIVDDCFEILLYYPNHRVRLKAGYIVKEATPSYKLFGTNGSFLKPRGDMQESLLQQNKKPTIKDWAFESKEDAGLLHYNKNGKWVKEKIKSLSGNYYNYYNQLYGALTANTVLPVTAEEGKQVMGIIEAAQKSNKFKKVIEI